MGGTTYTETKGRTQAAIADAYCAAEEFIDLGRLLLELIRCEGNEQERIVESIVNIYGTMQDTHAATLIKVYLVDEWLAQADTEIALRSNQLPEIKMPSGVFYTYHHAFMGEMGDLLRYMSDCAILRSPTVENFRDDLEWLSTWRRPPDTVDLQPAMLKIECYVAIGLWESSPRMDVDEAIGARTPKLQAKLTPPRGRPSETLRNMQWAKECIAGIDAKEWTDKQQFVSVLLDRDAQEANRNGRRSKTKRAIELALADGLEIIDSEKKRKQ